MVADYFGKCFIDFAIANNIRHVKTDRDNVWSIFEHVDMLYGKGSTKDFEQHFVDNIFCKMKYVQSTF